MPKRSRADSTNSTNKSKTKSNIKSHSKSTTNNSIISMNSNGAFNITKPKVKKRKKEVDKLAGMMQGITMTKAKNNKK